MVVGIVAAAPMPLYYTGHLQTPATMPACCTPPDMQPCHCAAAMLLTVRNAQPALNLEYIAGICSQVYTTTSHHIDTGGARGQPDNPAAHRQVHHTAAAHRQQHTALLAAADSTSCCHGTVEQHRALHNAPHMPCWQHRGCHIA
jgi:hypothetical protein